MFVNVTNFTNGEQVGKIKTNKSGKYSFVFPKGGKYNYEVKVDGSDDVYKFVVELPFLDEFRPLKQKAIHTTVDGEEIVKIVNLFDEKVEGAEALIAEVIRKKAALDVNIDQFDLKELDAQQNRDKILAEIGFSGMSIREVSNQLEELALTEELKQKQIQQIISNVNHEIVEKSKLLNVYETTLSDLNSRIAESSNPKEKHELLSESLRIENEKNTLIAEITQLENVKNKVAATSISLDGNNQLQKLEDDFKQLISEEKEEEALSLLISKKTIIHKTQKQSPTKVVNEMIEKSIALSNEIKELNQKQLSYEKNKSDLHSSNILLENSLPTAKKKEKETIKNKIASQKEEIDLLDEMITSNQQRIDEKNEQLYVLDNNIASVQKAMAEENDYTNLKSEVIEILAKTNNNKENTAILSIEKEIKTLEEEHPELAADYVPEVVENQTSKNDVATNIFANYNERKEEIQQSSELSSERKRAKIIALNNETKQELSERLNVLESMISEDDENNSLIQEKEQILAQKKQIETENESFEKEIIAEKNAIAAEKFKELKENRSKTFNEIDSDDSYSEIEKNQAKIDVNNEILQEIDTRLIEVRSVLAKNPSSKEKKQEQKELNTFVKEITKENEIFEREIEVLQSDVVENSTDDKQDNQSNEVVDNKVTSAAILNEIAPNYTEKIESIKDSSSFSEIEKLEALNKEDLAVLNELMTVQNKVEKTLKKDKENSQLIAKQEVLSHLIEGKQAAIKDRTVEIEQLSDTNLANNEQQVREELVLEINATYEQELADIQSSDASVFEKEKNILFVEQNKFKRITEKIESTEKLLSKDKENQRLKEELTILKELESKQFSKVEAQKTKAIASISVGEVEQVILEVDEKYSDDIAEIEAGNSTSKNEQKADRELVLQEKLQSKIEEIEKQQKRRFSVTVELDKAVYEVAFDESILRENSLREELSDISENIDNQIIDTSSNNNKKSLSSVKTENIEMMNDLEKLAKQSSDNSPIIAQTVEVNKEKTKEIERIEIEAKKAKSDAEREYLIQKAVLEQDQLNNTIASTIAEEKIKNIEEEFDISLSTPEELEQQRRKFTIRIGELTTEIIQVEQEIEEAKKKEIPALKEVKSGLVAEKALMETKLKAIEDKIIIQEKPAEYIPVAAKQVEITFNEERKIASSDNYKSYEEKAIKVLEIENQLRILEKQLIEERRNIRKLGVSANPVSSDEVKERASKVKAIEKEIEILNVDLIQKKYEANQELPEDKNEAMKIQNLVYRGIKPLKLVAVTAALLQMPSEGFAMNTTKASTYSASNPIPVDVKNPSGLVYRVQIGAFSKPIPQDLFKEFTPVSGELIKGTKITRYMAGFFNNSNTVVKARQSIRELGYSDAFIVAYCDGERIGFGEARRREANGTCVPKGTNELMVEVATNTAKKLGLPLTKEVKEVPELSYNEAPGAVDAEPIEMMQGLFFTVQIGVFNRPVSDEVIYNLPEILTVRLPNGQIRYNTGLFNSVTEALPRRKEALVRGIVGAFVVAYYQGGRIPLAHAKHLLNENGNSILQTELASKQVVKVEEEQNTVSRTDTVSMKNLVSNEEIDRIEQQRIQIVTKKEFSEFPRDVLNRYNAEGSFYYDERDKRVKSYIYKNVDDLPRLWNFVDDIDTVYLPVNELNLNLNNISVQLDANVIPGDFMDWILRTTYYHEITEMENGLEIRFYGIEKENIENLMTELKTFMLNPEIIEELEDE